MTGQFNDQSLLCAADIYSTADHRGLLPIGRSTFYKWIQEKHISPGSKIGGTRLWSFKEISALAAAPNSGAALPQAQAQ